jgi:hypothetical protein
MKTLKQILEVYGPETKDGKAFVQKHAIVKTTDANGNGDDVFQAAKIKKAERKKERHGYEPGDDEKVHEAVMMFADFINEGSKEDVEVSADYKEVIEPDGSVRKVRAKKMVMTKEMTISDDFKSFIKEHTEQMTDEELDLIEQIYNDLDEEEAQTFVSVVEAGELDSFLEELNKALEE